MRKTPKTFEAVRRLGLVLPDVEEGTTYGAPALKVHGRMFACLASHRSAEPDTLVVRVSFATRDGLLAEDPDTFYLTDHYVGYPCVLVRLARCRRDTLAELLSAGHAFIARAANVRPRKRPTA
jgi:hypothetical protein